MLNIVKNLIAASSVLARGDEHWRQFLPGVQQVTLVGGNSLLPGHFAEFVKLGKHYAERHAVLAEPLHKLQVNLLWLESAVDKHKEVGHLLTLEHIVLDNALELLAAVFAAAGITIAWQVNDVPLVVDEEVVYKQRLARSGRCLSQALVVGEHIDKRRLAHVGAANKRILGLVPSRALGVVGVTNLKFRGLDIHRFKFFDKSSHNNRKNKMQSSLSRSL